MSTTTTTLPSRMKAQYLDAFNTPYVLRETELPTITSSDDLLIKVTAASYCHTDNVLALGEMQPLPYKFPHIGCHEYAGTVTQLPPEPSTHAANFRIGDEVGVPGRAFHPCGTCYECRLEPSESDPDADDAGYSVYCPNSGNNGLSHPGGFREFAIVDARQVALLPAGMDAVNAAPLMCAGITIFAALKNCRLKEGQRVGIAGCGGGLGHLGLQFAVKMGYKVTGIDAGDKPMELAKGLGLDVQLIDSRYESASSIVEKIGAEDGKTDQREKGLDAVIVLPESQKAFDYSIELLKTHGKCILVSFPKTGFHLSAHDVVFRDISIRGSLVGTTRVLKEMLQFAAKHNIKAIIRRYRLEDLNFLVEDYLKGIGGKLVIEMVKAS